MRTAISRGLINRNVRYAAELGLVYLNNPKAGCSTLKFSLWTAVDELTGRKTFGGNVHARKADPFVRDVFALDPVELEKFRRSSMFSVVRNPFSRVLAAYLDKIPNDPSVWTAFHEGFGLRRDLTKDEFSFGDFLRLIDVAAPDLLDGHFRPQVDNLMVPYAKPDFIGYLEDMEPAKRYLAGFGVVMRDHVQHATKSADHLGEFFDPDAVELARKIYAEDFVSFGYSFELADAKLPGVRPGHDCRNGDMNLITQWIITEGLPPDVRSDSPDLRTFRHSRGRERKREIIQLAVDSASDWSQLKHYAKYAKARLADNDLTEALVAKMVDLRNRYEQVVRRPSIFLPMRQILGMR